MSRLSRFFGGINIKEFMSTSSELHAFVEGLGDGYCPWESRYGMSDELSDNIMKEHHYYSFGTVVGFAGLIFSIAGAVRIVFEAIW